jgi:enoyl-CoA hydratase/carnithine racemase
MTFRRHHAGPVALITIDRPEKRNALTLSAIDELTALIKGLGHDPGVSGLVLTGNGAFCSGADLGSILAKAAEGPGGIEETIELGPQRLVRALLDLPFPTVAALNGPAIGMGMDLALACDSRLLSPSGWMLQGWGRVGLIPGAGGELLLRQRNPSILWKLLEEQRPIDGLQAERWGLGEPVDGDAVKAAVQRLTLLAQRLPRAALATYAELFRRGLRQELDEHLAVCARAQVDLLTDGGFTARVANVVGSAPRRAE